MISSIPRIGLMGVQCDNPNLGLVALSYSIVGILHQMIPGEAEVVFFSINSDDELQRLADTLRIDNKSILAVPFNRKSPAALLRSFRAMRQCDVIVDFTGGDSFSDIYGSKRIAKKLGDKTMALASRTPLILGPQTFGPFERKALLPWVRFVIDHAAMVFTRDDASKRFLATITDRDVCVATDVAVTLPWSTEQGGPTAHGDTHVGFNVSGLLWNGGYTGDNQFALVANYRDYCHRLVDALAAEGFAVVLVPHVVAPRDAASVEDDVAACLALAADHPHCTVAPPFQSPVEAKSYISRLDLFVGSRMHATIASFTSGIPTIPVAYSRKFTGFFGSLGYEPLVDLSILDTGQAVDSTIEYCHRRHELADEVAAGSARAQDRIRAFVAGLAGALPAAASA